MLLNIIHPYTYKLKGETIQIGPCPEFEDRDRAVTAFVEKMLDSDSKVLLHLRYDGNKMHQVLEDVALRADPLYRSFFNEHIERVMTTGYGVPIPEENLKRLNKVQRESIKDVTTDVQLGIKMRGHKQVIFIGGMLENCVTNMIGYFDSKYRVEGQDVFYIPELCVSWDEVLWSKVQGVLEERKIYSISVEDVFKRLKLAKDL